MKSKTIRYIIFLDLKKENKKALILKTERGNLRISQFFFRFPLQYFVNSRPKVMRLKLFQIIDQFSIVKFSSINLKMRKQNLAKVTEILLFIELASISFEAFVFLILFLYPF